MTISTAGVAGKPSPNKTSPARRKQEDRSRDARERLLGATIEILLKRGYSGLTTKEVAKTAGMSNGALMHHYATKAELVIAATKAVYDEWILRGQRIARTPGAVENPLEGFISDSTSVYFDWPYIAALEVVMVARTDEALMEHIVPVMQHYRETTNDLWREVFVQAGYTESDADTILNLTLNIVRGMGINRTWKRDDARYQALLSDWVQIVNQQYKPQPNKAVRKRPTAPAEP
ncbi:TetR/AcrR family transcriptional regulator [Pusillimonas sp. CC-YST705]|uniref:TetR/AcrR family transcriptional regulator n=2 Tax=Mesopusillimonas faecipullorum TaxID=2755040 RepID=A0ABS8CDT4_9BURK|nr:TetR/AcrR family transcriptional regulator [Mesopusillimonas faecipullorum]